jgi:Xaa-Pro aminopeptidase
MRGAVENTKREWVAHQRQKLNRPAEPSDNVPAKYTHVDFADHVKRVVEEIVVKKGLDALIVASPPNIFYLVGSDAPSAVVLFSDSSVRTLSSRLEYTRALDEARLGEHFVFSKSEDVCEYENIVKGDFYEALASLVKGSREGRLGAAGFSPEALRKLEEKVGGGVADVTADFKLVRRSKDPSEIAAIRAAVHVAERALAKALGNLERGVTEAEIAAIIASEIIKSGAELAFPPIVAFGEHAAHPHAKPGLRRLKDGDLVTIDLGARVEGYCSDITRTVAFGKAGENEKRVFNAVLRAQEEALALLKAGVEAREAHMRAYEVLKSEGLSKYFNHGLGHGVGVEIHEDPSLNAESQAKLVHGDVVTVEPGVYVHRVGGVRIEDMALVLEGKAELLTSFPKRLEV